MEVQNTVQGVQEAPQKKSSNKKLLFILGGVLLACICFVVIGVVAFFVLFAPNTKDYLQKTDSNYTDVKSQLAKVQDSILNDYAVDSTGDKYTDIKAKVDNAYTLAADLETKVTNAENVIPVAGSDTKTLDTELKDYYKSTKELATSYKELLAAHQAALPLLKSVEDMGTVFTSFGGLQTAADYTKLGKTLKEQRVIFQTHKDNLANIKTTPETEFVKTNIKTTITTVIDLLDAFIKFTDKGAIAMQTDDQTALAAAGQELTTATTKFQSSTADTTFADKKKTLVAGFKSKLDQIKIKQDQVDTELTKVKATVK